MSSQDTLPSQHRALVLETVGAGFEIKQLPTPQAFHGSAVIKVEQAGILSYHREIYNGVRKYDFPKPIVGGCSSIGRVVALGPDATSLKVGQMVYADCVIYGRDDHDHRFLTAIHHGGTEGSQKLCRDVWRNGPFAEYLSAPLENCIPLDEARLCGELGYTMEQLMYIGWLIVPFGGFRDINLQPGETVIISPATGPYGGAAVQTAVAIGATVIAMGRNEAELARLKAHVQKGTPSARIETVRISGDQAADTASLQVFGPVDAVLDFSPPMAVAAKSTHLKSALSCLRRNGRASLMGFVGSDLPIDSWNFISKNITLKGKLMYEREDMLLFNKMLHAGRFPRGEDFADVKTYPLEDWKNALDEAAEFTGIGRLVSLSPTKAT
ncbi:unnamed protein product [Clonostachys rosea f. rosea IK726]|uniref:Uncharacterized protein n=2 Tax=Bionectria ochroleuca TaxID=29856 RepID=A0A0B7KE77_BIOOC|nr:unnamed protein product [Clonostachys rosea f. rosea IK726]